MNEQLFIDKLKEYNIEVSQEQLKKFRKYFELLVAWNEKMNLTAITDQGEVFEKHFFDSITPAFYFDFSTSDNICDVGAGAGFPSIPLKILYPHLKLTIIDSLNKRITFLTMLAEELELKECNFVHDRAENFGQNSKYREKFDVVTARAVARLSVLGEYCLPLVKVGGYFIALKGTAADDELKDAKEGIKELGGKIQKVISLELPVEKSQRKIVLLEKDKKTPKKYPRKPGVITKNPL